MIFTIVLHNIYDLEILPPSNFYSILPVFSYNLEFLIAFIWDILQVIVVFYKYSQQFYQPPGDIVIYRLYLAFIFCFLLFRGWKMTEYIL